MEPSSIVRTRVMSRLFFPLNQVIPGWTESVQLMNVGSKIQLFLPPNMAYGDRGAPPVIEPGSMLIFEVELLGIETVATK